MGEPGDVTRAVCLWVEGLTSLTDVLETFRPLGQAIEGFLVTAYLPPAVVGPLPPSLPRWLRVGPLGWEGSPHECEAWGRDETEALVRLADAMGYRAPLMPPRNVHGPREDLVRGCPWKPIHWPGERSKLVREIGMTFDRANPDLPYVRDVALLNASTLGAHFDLYLPTDVVSAKEVQP